MNELFNKEQSYPIELADVAAGGALAQRYEAAKRRRIRKGIFYWLKQVGNILWAALSGLSFLKYFIPSTMVVSALSLGSTIKNMVDKKKTLALIAGVVLLGLFDLAISTGYDLVKWGVTIPGVAVASLSLAAVATIVLTILTVVSAVDFFRSWAGHRKNPERTTPVQKFELVNKATNAVLFFAVAVCIPVLVLCPPLTVIFMSIAAASFLTFLTMQIVGWVKKNRAWDATIKGFQTAKKDPYLELFTPAEKLEFSKRLLQKKVPESILQKIKEGWKSLFGSEAEKAELEEKKQATASAHIKEIYEKKVQDCVGLDREAKIKKLQAAYDLLRETDGRIKLEEAKALAKAEEYFEDKRQRGESFPKVGHRSAFAQSLLPPDYRTTSDVDFLNGLKPSAYRYGQGTFRAGVEEKGQEKSSEMRYSRR